MTGTSIDAIDIAAVRIDGRGFKARATLLGQSSASLGALAERLRSAQRQVPLSAGAFVELARDLALAHIAPLRELARAYGAPDLIALHGQTLYHKPPLSLQLIDANVVAQEFGCTVVSNLRAADLAAGGQGAPITPLSDWMMFRSKTSWRAILNLGGFANATLLPPAPPARAGIEEWIALVRGCDLCLCNQLLDHITRTTLGIPFDEGGKVALAGRANAAAVEALFALLDSQRRSARSLGTTDEIVTTAAEHVARLAPPDALASATSAIAKVIGRAIEERAPATTSRTRMKIFVAGGGIRNEALLAQLKREVPGVVLSTDTCGVPPDARESMAMAVLGALAEDGCPMTLPAVTGRASQRAIDGSFVKFNPLNSHNLHTWSERAATALGHTVHREST